MKRSLLLFLLLASPVAAEPLFPPAEYVLWDTLRSAGLRGTGASGGGITAGTTLIPACTSKFLFADASSTVNCNAAFVSSDTGSGSGVITLAKSPSGASQTSNYISLTGTLPTQSVSMWPVYFKVTGSGSASIETGILNVEYIAGYTGLASNYAIRAATFSAGTGTTLVAMDSTTGPSSAILGRSVGTSVGSNTGGTFQASGGLENAAIVADATTAKASGWNVGAIILGRNTGATPSYNGAFIGLNAGGADPVGINSALQVTNSDQAAPILLLQDGTTRVLTVADGGAIQGDITKTLTDNTVATFAISTLGNDTYSGGTVHYCIYVADATTAALECGSVDLAGVDVTAGAGGEVCTTPGKIGTPLQALSGATLAVTFAATTGTELCNWRVTADGNIATPVTFTMRYTIMTQSGQAITPN